MTVPAIIVPPQAGDAVDVIRRLREAGHVALLAGGCVRDLLLGRAPTDFDVATDAPPARVRALFANTQAVGAAFGVILVRHRGSQIEVATFRTDGDYHDGRRPDAVVFSTPRHDAARRDFTINGLFLDPVSGQVIDHVGGVADLTGRLIRAIGNPDDRFGEDHLRLLRAVRFAARLDFDVEAKTAAAIKNNARALVRISPERVADELRRMLTAPGHATAWRLLHVFDLLSPLFRFLPPTAGRVDPAVSLFVAQPAPPASFGLAVAGLTFDDRWQRAGCPPDPRPWLEKKTASALTRGLRQALKLSNDESAEMQDTLTQAGVMLADPTPPVAAKKRFLAHPAARTARAFLDLLAGGNLLQTRISQLQSDLTTLEKTDYAPAPLVTGDDLTAAGATPGPYFKIALDAAFDEQLEGRLDTKAAALQFALDRIH